MFSASSVSDGGLSSASVAITPYWPYRSTSLPGMGPAVPKVCHDFSCQLHHLISELVWKATYPEDGASLNAVSALERRDIDTTPSSLGSKQMEGDVADLRCSKGSAE